jgi:F420-dependent oxidoreductase-like protein
MRLGFNLLTIGKRLKIDIEAVKRAESMGYDSAWSAEAWGSDAITPLAYVAGHTTKLKLGTSIIQIPARTPAMTAMTAMSLDQLSNGRIILGLGISGPQVVEGWHGVPYKKPLSWMREYITILRTIFAREEKLNFQGQCYRIPYDGEDGMGQGKPLKSLIHGRKDIPIWTGSMSPKGQQLAGEIADGCLLVWMDPRKPDLILDNFRAGFEKAGGGKSLADFNVAPTVNVVVGDDLERCRFPVKSMLALYLGGMGSRKKNFYNEYAQRIGYEAEAKKIQDLYLDGKKKEATAQVPNELVDAVALVGPKERIAERFSIWKDLAKEGKIGTFIVAGQPGKAHEVIAELAS